MNTTTKCNRCGGRTGQASPCTCGKQQHPQAKPATITINGCELPAPVPELSSDVYQWRMMLCFGNEKKTLYWPTREGRDAVYAKLVEVLGS